MSFTPFVLRYIYAYHPSAHEDVKYDLQWLLYHQRLPCIPYLKLFDSLYVLLAIRWMRTTRRQKDKRISLHYPTDFPSS